MRRAATALVLMLALASCGPSPAATDVAPPATAEVVTVAPTSLPPTASPTEVPTATAAPVEPTTTIAPVPVALDYPELFTEAAPCGSCHQGMVDAKGVDVSPNPMWAGTMMANAARDPYWQATVRAESLANPHLQAVIEDKCATCHMPMARTTIMAAGGEGATVLDAGALDPNHPLHALAMDGVSCTLCHQIQPDGLGTEDSVSGTFLVDATAPMGQRPLFGTFRTTHHLTATMTNASGFVAAQSDHIAQAELCATCHTLYTPFVDEKGEVAGVFPEQMAYLEWQASTFGQAVPCQGCHMTPAAGEVPLSNMSAQTYGPMGVHQLTGGNTLVLDMLDARREELGVTATAEQLQGRADYAVTQVGTRAASLTVAPPTLDGDTLVTEVTVRPLTGHKFPTGFPSRRVWLHVTVLDAHGDVVFESGAWTPDGAIAGNANDEDAEAYEPHYAVITAADQVQIYESILGTVADVPTTTLLLGAQYLKDNRLLPAGFAKTDAVEDIAVRGDSVDDEDFTGGSDLVRYEVDTAGREGPFTVQVELLYQPIGFRWARHFDSVDGAEAELFVGAYDELGNPPLLVAQAEASSE